ncbi:MAG: ABC transporter ATP-binding protein [Tissierellia bacterium]|nr:ABC transporter ATP-binding protein [Tissierellia bacterium]
MKLKIENLNKSFRDNHVLKDINLEVSSGEIFGYLGRNGAGKTTSIRILMDVFQGDSGKITMDGEDFDPSLYKIGYLPEERGMYSKYKVGEQLMYFAQLRGASKAQAKKSMDHWSKEFEIEKYLNAKLETLSKGNQQKVQITQAFINEPDILILDEPFSGLDPVNAKVFQDALVEYIRGDKIIIFSSHQMSYVESFCNDIAIIDQGKIVLQGNLKEIKKKMGQGKLRLRLGEDKDLSFLAGRDFFLDEEDIILTLKPTETKKSFLQNLLDMGVDLLAFNDYLPSLQEIFIQKAGDKHEAV